MSRLKARILLMVYVQLIPTLDQLSPSQNTHFSSSYKEVSLILHVSDKVIVTHQLSKVHKVSPTGESGSGFGMRFEAP